jgi:hypothetical protein
MDAGIPRERQPTKTGVKKSDRDAKAELNRRSQVCEFLAGTGVRVAKMACRAEARRAKAGVPCGSCTHLNGFADRCLGCSANGTKFYLEKNRFNSGVVMARSAKLNVPRSRASRAASINPVIAAR